LKVSLLFFCCLITSFVWGQSDTLKTVDLETNAFQKPVGFQIKTLKIDSIELNNRLSDVLTKESSVFVKQYGPGNLASISVRGTSSSQNQVFWNGIPMSSVTLGQVNLNLIRPLTSNSIKMIFGGGESGSYPGAIGSSIYLNNVLEFKKKTAFSYSGYYGAFESYRQNGIIAISDTTKAIMFSWNSARSLNNFEYYNTYNGAYQLREETKQVNLDYSLHAALKTSKHSQIKLNVLLGDSKKDIPRPISINVPLEKQIQNDETRLVTLGWNYNKKLNKIGLQWGHQKLRNYFDDLATTSKASVININQHFLQARMSSRLSKKSKILWSWDSEFSYVESTGFESKKNRQLNFMNLGYIYTLNREISLSLNIKPTKLDNQDIDVLSNVAIEYTPKSTLKVYGHLNNNVRYPTLNDLYWENGGNRSLSPERSIQLEIGAIKEINKTNINFNAYNNRVNNWILWQPQTTGLWSPENVYKVNSYGIEVGVSRSFRCFKESYIDVNITSTLGRAYNVDTRKDLIYMPRRKFLYSIKYVTSLVNIQMQGETSSPFYITTDNTAYMPKYSIHNLRMSKVLKLNNLKIQLNLEVNNILNSDFQVVANYPMPRRHVNFGFILSQIN